MYERYNPKRTFFFFFSVFFYFCVVRIDLNRKKDDVVCNNEPINQSTCFKYGIEHSNHLKFVECIGFSD